MIIDQIKEDLNKARIMRDELWTSTLRTLLGDLQKFEKDGNELTDEYVVSVVKKYVKNAKECIDALEKRENPELYEPWKYQTEIEQLNRYLPKQLTETQVVDIIKANFNDDEITIKDCMQYLKKNYGDSVDGKVASKTIKGMIG